MVTEIGENKDNVPETPIQVEDNFKYEEIVKPSTKSKKRKLNNSLFFI